MQSLFLFTQKMLYLKYEQSDAESVSHMTKIKSSSTEKQP